MRIVRALEIFWLHHRPRPSGSLPTLRPARTPCLGTPKVDPTLGKVDLLAGHHQCRPPPWLVVARVSTRCRYFFRYDFATHVQRGKARASKATSIFFGRAMGAASWNTLMESTEGPENQTKFVSGSNNKFDKRKSQKLRGTFCRAKKIISSQNFV